MEVIAEMLGSIENMNIIFKFIVLFFLLNSLIINKKARLFISFFTSLFVSSQIASLYFTQTFIGYQFYVHANLRGITGMQGLFINQITIIALIFVLLILIYYYSVFAFKKLYEIIKNNNRRIIIKYFKIAAIVIMFFITFTNNNFTNDTKTLLTILAPAKTENFEQILKKHNLSDYVTSNQIKSKPGKNIIVISMESIERAFLNGKYSHLTPNLNKLKKEWNYVDMEQNTGSGWTSGSLYTYLTGFPAFFGHHENKIFQSTYHSNISSISEALDKSNYKTVYMNGNTNHSGVKEMLNVMHFDKIIDCENVKTKGFESPYGIRDKDLFKYAKTKIKKLESRSKPFALFISTTDTHFPNGLYDKRMESIISKKDSDLEFMIAALDYLIGDFISFLKENKVLENTVVYIFPDHLKMGDPSMFKYQEDRGLFLISNTKTFKTKSETLYQIDLPKLILKGANVEHNLKFLTDYIKGDKEDYIKNNMLALTEINTNGILNSGFDAFNPDNISENYHVYKKDTSRFIAHAGGIIDGEIYTNSKEALDYNYSKGFRLFELDILETKDGRYVAAHEWEQWAKMTNFKGELPPTYNQFMERKILDKFTPFNLDSINNWFDRHKDAILITDKINNPAEFSEVFIDKNRLMMEVFDKKALEDGLNSDILSTIPSQSIIKRISIDEVEDYAERGVKHIALSRDFIPENKELLSELKKYNIKVYAYNINYTAGVDEDYVVKYEMDYIYGIYADDWSFEN